jgi:predicted site-specific integrase-resolvase
MTSQDTPNQRPGFWDFAVLAANVPLGERTLREYVRRGTIPSIVLPGGRRRLFDPAAVRAALLRHQSGSGI